MTDKQLKEWLVEKEKFLTKAVCNKSTEEKDRLVYIGGIEIVNQILSLIADQATKEQAEDGRAEYFVRD